MSNTRNLLIVGGGALLLLVAAALWVLLQPPRGQAQTLHLLSATNTALDVRYHYDPGLFQPAPFDPRAEFPLRLDAKDWSFYGKRIQGVGGLLVKEPQPVVYSMVNDLNVSVYKDFYKLVPDSALEYQTVPLAGKTALRQRLSLALGPDSRGWPPYFPQSVIGNQPNPLAVANPIADKAFHVPEVDRMKKEIAEQTPLDERPQPKCNIYGWALFTKDDLFFFQAVSTRPLDELELESAEALISSMDFNALLAAPGTPEPPAATAPAAPAAPATPAEPDAAPAEPGAAPAAPPAPAGP